MASHRLFVGLSLMLAAHGVASRAAAARTTLLPSQQRVRQIGKSVDLGLFPAGMALSSDDRLILVTNNGFINQSVTVVDTETLQTTSRQFGLLGSDTLFVGVALSPDGRTGFASGHLESGPDVIYRVAIAPGPTLTPLAPINLPAGTFAAGLAMNRDGTRLFVAANLTAALLVVDPHARTVLHTIPVGRLPWGVALHPSLPRAYVTNRADNTVSIVDLEAMTVTDTVPTGLGPNAIAVSPDGGKIVVADATSDDLTVFDVDHPESPRTLSLLPFDGALPGSSPNAVTFSPDGRRLYVANAWANHLVVINPATETVEGLIPTGWYPTAVAVRSDNKRLYVTNMKGAQTYPRTQERQTRDYTFNIRAGGSYYVRGTLQTLPVPSHGMLRGLERRVRFFNGDDTGIRPSNRRPPDGPCFPIPCGPGDISPIKHVVFIVRENKTYDQDLGDLPQGDGEPSLVIYGRTITPNLHALVEQFVLLDRFFADSEKSEAGHQWTTASIDSDYVEKTWTSATEGGRPDDIGVHADQGYVLPVAQPAGLYWFDNCYVHDVSFRNYGEFLRADDSGTPIDYWVTNTDADFRRFDLDYPDQQRFEEWKREFDEQVRTDTFPQFTYIALPQDHTKGTTAGMPDPRSFVADNDYATGQVVEAISNSSYWRETAIFLLEDDPQSGGDHIDSHRTVGTIISPWVRRGTVSHTRFDMASMHRTMELILGLPPMSRFDQMAIPMRELFTDTPDERPYTAVPISFPFTLTRANPGSALSARQNWRAADKVPDHVLNQLLWDYLKGDGAGK